jgi:hypothetical protein
MFLVGGGILPHGLPGTHDLIHSIAHGVGTVPGAGGILEALTPFVADGLVGVLAGALILSGVTLGQRALRRGPQIE